MTDTISRADALAAIEGIQDTGEWSSDETQAFQAALAAINALPAASVTDDMVERGARAIVTRNWPSLTERDVDHMWADHAEDVRAALEAALPDAP